MVLRLERGPRKEQRQWISLHLPLHSWLPNSQCDEWVVVSVWGKREPERIVQWVAEWCRWFVEVAVASTLRVQFWQSLRVSLLLVWHSASSNVTILISHFRSDSSCFDLCVLFSDLRCKNCTHDSNSSTSTLHKWYEHVIFFLMTNESDIIYDINFLWKMNFITSIIWTALLQSIPPVAMSGRWTCGWLATARSPSKLWTRHYHFHFSHNPLGDKINNVPHDCVFIHITFDIGL